MISLVELLSMRNVHIDIDIEKQKVLSCILAAEPTRAMPCDSIDLRPGTYGWSLCEDVRDSFVAIPTSRELYSLGYDTDELSELAMGWNQPVQLSDLEECFPREVAAIREKEAEAQLAMSQLRKSLSQIRRLGAEVDVGVGMYCPIWFPSNVNEGFPASRQLLTRTDTNAALSRFHAELERRKQADATRHKKSHPANRPKNSK